KARSGVARTFNANQFPFSLEPDWTLEIHSVCELKSKSAGEKPQKRSLHGATVRLRCGEDKSKRDRRRIELAASSCCGDICLSLRFGLAGIDGFMDKTGVFAIQFFCQSLSFVALEPLLPLSGGRSDAGPP